MSLLGGTVFAQGGAPAGGGYRPASTGEQTIGTMSPEEMVAHSRAYVQAMNDVLKRIQGLQDTARRQKDIIKLNCVTDKLTQTKVNLNLLDQGIQSMHEAFGRNDASAGHHQYARLTIINQKTTLLGAEAENCIGEDLTYVGKAKVEVEVDPKIPLDDPSEPQEPVTVVERPGPASRY